MSMPRQRRPRPDQAAYSESEAPARKPQAQVKRRPPEATGRTASPDRGTSGRGATSSRETASGRSATSSRSAAPSRGASSSRGASTGRKPASGRSTTTGRSASAVNRPFDDAGVPRRAPARGAEVSRPRPVRPAPPPPARPKKGKKRRRKQSAGRIAITWLAAVVLAVVLGFVCKTFVFELVSVNGDAMYPTLLGSGDMVLVTKFDYFSSSPNAGDIVAINSPKGLILRRVIAVPGQTVAIEGGNTIVDGQILPETYVASNGKDPGDHYAEVRVPSGRFFVLGDYRVQKYDSRDSEVDLVNKNSIVGRVRFRVFPFRRDAV